MRVLSLLLAAGAIVAALTLFFKVGAVEVTGNSRYTAEEIASVAGVELGDNLILLDRYHAAARLYTQLPYITDVRIDPRLPDTLSIEVTETKAAVALRGGGSWWLASSSGKLLEAVDTAAAQDYPTVQGAELVEPVGGGKLLLNDGESPLSTQRLLELVAAMEERGMLTRLDGIDLTDSEELVLHYDGRFQAELYYDADFDFKLDCLLATVEQLEPNETGIIRMTMENDRSVRFIQAD